MIKTKCPTEKSLNSTVCEKAEPITRKVVNINFVTLIVTIFSIMAIPNLTFPYRKKKKKSFSRLLLIIQTLFILFGSVFNNDYIDDPHGENY